MRVLIVSDAWEPQVNGVVRTLRSTMEELRRSGHEITLLAPDQFSSLPCPTYKEIRLSLTSTEGVGRRIDAASPDAIHIATEGPLGLAARRWCLRRSVPFTTAYHTQFPDYLAKRTHLPASCFWHYIRWFHRPSEAILVSTRTIARELAAHGLPHTRIWGRGVDLACFHPQAPPLPDLSAIPRPILLYVGRIAPEKNVGAFLESSHPGSKILVGDGPDLARLKRLHPEATFLGPLHGDALASAYSAADILVFPSRTDTFGLVMIEALACGTPVAAFPVPGPVDVLNEEVGCLDANLDSAITGALRRSRQACATYAHRFSWQECTRQFVSALAPLDRQPGADARLKANLG